MNNSRTELYAELYEAAIKATVKAAEKVPEDKRTRQAQNEKAHPLWLLGHLAFSFDTVVNVWALNGEPVACLADLIIGADASRPTELTLILVCPRCSQGQKHAQDCQLRIRQSNRFFEFVAGKGDPMIEFQGEMFRSAGMIVASEVGALGMHR